jgi:hypothetical protein
MASPVGQQPNANTTNSATLAISLGKTAFKACGVLLNNSVTKWMTGYSNFAEIPEILVNSEKKTEITGNKTIIFPKIEKVTIIKEVPLLQRVRKAGSEALVGAVKLTVDVGIGAGGMSKLLTKLGYATAVQSFPETPLRFAAELTYEGTRYVGQGMAKVACAVAYETFDIFYKNPILATTAASTAYFAYSGLNDLFGENPEEKVIKLTDQGITTETSSNSQKTATEIAKGLGKLVIASGILTGGILLSKFVNDAYPTNKTQLVS